ncbi:hypothetical protein DFJ73DRAFT_861568 [Zopfochytrium polystomum]|nr:hypothetical protein DFJ73DRAFT_861568 [Zopfochytrium polystomum]
MPEARETGDLLGRPRDLGVLPASSVNSTDRLVGLEPGLGEEPNDGDEPEDERGDSSSTRTRMLTAAAVGRVPTRCRLARRMWRSSSETKRLAAGGMHEESAAAAETESCSNSSSSSKGRFLRTGACVGIDEGDCHAVVVELEVVLVLLLPFVVMVAMVVVVAEEPDEPEGGGGDGGLMPV